MQKFSENRPYIENEFEEAVWDPSSGLDVAVLSKKLEEIQNTQTDKPRQLVCAEVYAYLLDHVQIQINPRTPFAAKINIGVDYSRFAGYDIFHKTLFLPQREKIISELFPEDYAKMTEAFSVGVGEVWTDFWHTVPNWNFLLEHGFAGILRLVEESRQKKVASGSFEEKHITFWDSVIICYRAILRLLKRIHEASLRYDIPEFSQCIQNLMTQPPKSLYEVMQLSVLFLYVEEIGCERGRTLGHIDRMYWPYYQADLQKGVPLDAIKELFCYFFIHFTATKRFAEQPFAMGGGDADGTDYVNELSLLILDIYDEMNIFDPKIHLRYHANMDPRILTKALSMIRRGNSSICIINDEAVFKGYERLGIPQKDAQDYVLLGCYEPIIIGKEEGEIGITWLNMVKSIEFALNGGNDVLTGKAIGVPTGTDFADFESFLQVYFEQLDACMDFAIDFAQRQGEYSTLVNPSPIYSSTFPECLEKGMDVHEYPLQYNNMSLKCFGLATVVDSLTTIKTFVFEKKEVTLEELRQALAADWYGYEDLQTKIRKSREKYGNNQAVPDAVMLRVTGHLEEKYCGLKLKRGGVLRMGFDSIDWCIYFGSQTAATPDGRKSGTPLSKNLCPSAGMDRAGITAYMQSVLKINTDAFVNSAILDFILHPSAVEGEKGLADFAALVKTFFAFGGFAIQGNIVNSETLKEAQKDPEKYKNLQISVCGWNEYFVKMSKEKQELFIRQCEKNRS